MTRYPGHLLTFRALLFLCLVLLFLTASLFLFKATITGQAAYDAAGGQENLTVTFDAKPIPADAVVIAHVAGMTGQRPLRMYASQAPLSIIYGGSSVQGYHERITVSFESFGITIPEGEHNLSVDILYEGNVIDRIVVPVHSGAQGQPRSQRIAMPEPPRQERASYPVQAFVVGLSIISFLVALLIALFHYRILDLPADLLKTSGVADELIRIISKERANGHPDPKIMQHLKEIAPHDEIVAVFVELDGDKIRSYIRSHEKKGYSTAQIRLALERRHLKDVVDAVFDGLH